MQDRRDFLKTGFSIAAAGLAGAAALTGARRSLAEEAPPETTSVRLPKIPGFTCIAPLDILDDLLREEGFSDIRYVPGADLDIGADRLRERGRGLRPGFCRHHDLSCKDRRRRSLSHAWLGCIQPVSSCSPIEFDPQCRRPEGQDRLGVSDTSGTRHRLQLAQDHRRQRRARSRQGHQLGVRRKTPGVKRTFSQTAKSTRS